MLSSLFALSRGVRGLCVLGALCPLLGVVVDPAAGQPTSTSPLAPPQNGPRRSDPSWVALSDVTVHAKPGEASDAPLHRAVVVYKDGVIQAIIAGDVGPDAKAGTEDDIVARAPMGPAIVKATGLHLYPAFIDAYVEVDAPLPPTRGDGRGAQRSHWNSGITPERWALDGPGVEDGVAKSLRDLGFGAAGISPKGGNVRGRGAVVSLARTSGSVSAPKPPVYRDEAFQTFSFETGGRGYPDSQMGAIALVRQVLRDAMWMTTVQDDALDRAEDASLATCLEFLAPSKLESLWLLFDSSDELEALRATRVFDEFVGLGGKARGMLVLGCGTEYARLDAIAEDAHAYILPLNFPKAPDVSSPGKAEATELREMMAWEQAATNPRRLANAGIEFALTTSKLRKRDEFPTNLRKAIAAGLTPERAFASLTTAPARMLGVEDVLGTIEEGKRANFILASGPMFDKKTKIRATIIDGILHEVEKEKVDLSGVWRTDFVTPDGAVRWMEVGKDGSVEVKKATPGAQPGEKARTVSAKARKVAQLDNVLSYVFDHDDFGDPGVASVAMTFDLSQEPASATGRVLLPDGRSVQYRSTREPRSLAGDWPVLFVGDEIGERVGTIIRIEDADVLSKDRTPSVRVVRVDPTTKEQTTTPARNVRREDETLVYEVPRTSSDPQDAEAGEPAAIIVTLRPEPTPEGEKSPAMLTGTMLTQEGSSRFDAARIADSEKWWLGKWAVVRADGMLVTPDQRGMEGVMLEFSDKNLVVVISRTDEQRKAKKTRIEADDLKIEGNTITFSHDLKPLGMEGKSSDVLTRVGAELRGVGTMPDGSTHEYAARLEPKAQESEDEFETLLAGLPEALPVPFGPYGLFEAVEQGVVVVRNATVWTNDDAAGGPDTGGSRGILTGHDVLIEQGVIRAIVPSSEGVGAPEGARVIDAARKHLTAGIIDAHSHTGISRGVNEGGQAVTSEVRIEDVTNPDDVNWYRQLASGVTSVLQLHGSANAIGGQSQTTKLRWGVSRPEAMHMDGASPGIKFALGENPKQVNWNSGTTRYPRSRMGVEMLIRDRFTAAREYMQAKQSSTPPRIDLELEPLAEILAGTRLVHCHSYRQDEIVMLTQVARDFGFTIGTFQHILEGYKVADFVRDYSGGGSGFADWWAFKVEVQDAIPAGLPLMQKVGATTSFNSDSNSLARFLNVEAAKAVKYGREVGGFSESEAWKFVTLNPAKQLRINDHVGAIRPGMDADVVLWSGNPLSTYSVVERTWVDGRELYSLEQDRAHREWIAKERTRLIAKLLADKKKKPKQDEAEQPRDDKKDTPSDSSADSLSDEQREQLRRLHMEMLRSGRDPRYAPGVCGCGWHAW